jgi:hypothetical protein
MSATRVTAHRPAGGREGVGILLVMRIPVSIRVYVMTVAMVVCVVASGACFGLVVARWAGALVGSGAAGVGGLRDGRPPPSRGDSVRAAGGDGRAGRIGTSVPSA